MKTLLLSSVAMAGLIVAAQAADLPSRRAAPIATPYVAVPVFTWTGFYVGVNAGYGFSDSNNNNLGTGLAAVGPAVATPVVGTFGTTTNNNRDGFVGGGQVGYNYQMGQVVVGIEGDIQYTDFGRRGNSVLGTAVPNANILGGSPNVAFFNRGNQSDYFGTVRGRVGYAFDRALVYGTGGVAFRDSDRRDNTFFGVTTGYNRGGEDVGYAVGGGVEYAFTPNITAKVEGLYVNFSDKGRGGLGGNVVGVTNTGAPIVAVGSNRRDDDFAVVRAGINYKFTSF